MTAERIKSRHGEGRNSNKPSEPWRFLEATGSHFAVKVGHHGRHFVRSNGCASSHLVLAEGKKINIARDGGWLCPGWHQRSSSTRAKHCKYICFVYIWSSFWVLWERVSGMGCSSPPRVARERCTLPAPVVPWGCVQASGNLFHARGSEGWWGLQAPLVGPSAAGVLQTWQLDRCFVLAGHKGHEVSSCLCPLCCMGRETGWALSSLLTRTSAAEPTRMDLAGRSPSQSSCFCRFTDQKAVGSHYEHSAGKEHWL